MTRNVYGAVLAMHMDGANNGTVFTDNAGHTVTPYGNAKTSTTQAKFGQSAYFDGTGDYLTIPASTDFVFTGDFTIELWFNTTQGRAYSCLIGRDTGAFPVGSWAVFTSDSSANGKPEIWWRDYSGGSPLLTSSSSGYNDGAQHHLAWVRHGNDHTLYLDGVSKATRNTAATMVDNGAVLCIGNDYGYSSREYAGYIDELIIFQTALYTANFTPPTEAFTWVQPPITQIKFNGIPNNANARSPVSCISFARDGVYAVSQQNTGVISDTVAVTGSPEALVSRRVTLVDRYTMQSVASVWSDPATGAYSFAHLRKDVPFMVVADDYLGVYNAVVADWQYAN